MVNPVGFDTHRPVAWPEPAHEPVTFKPLAVRNNERSAEEEAASLYYVTTLKSLKASADAPATTSSAQAVTANGEKKSEKSFIGRVGDWLWGLLGMKKQQPEETAAADTNNAPAVQPLDRAPQLRTPNASDTSKLSKAVAELNRELVTRLKEISEFEEEMRKASSGQLDKMILVQFVSSSMAQKQLKEQSSVGAQEDLLDLHRKNKVLKQANYNLQQEIVDRARKNSILSWVNMGATVGIVGSLAAGFATGGAGTVFAFALPLFSLTKGGTTLATGALKYKNDTETGRLVGINQESKTNSTHMNDRLSVMHLNDEDIGTLLKTIRHHLDNQSQATRAMLGRS